LTSRAIYKTDNVQRKFEKVSANHYIYFISKNAAEPVQIRKLKTVQKLMVTKKNTLIEA
jgi:hypothetical protein